MKKQLTTVLSLMSLFFSLTTNAQNCGQVVDFNYSATNNGNGTSNYTFYIETAPVSGGTKSVQVSISCGGFNYITNECQPAPSAGTIITIGPFNNVATCSSAPELTWSGYTNDKCGGSSCAGSTIALPVELMYIETNKVNLGVQINWAAASEINNQGFEIERSTDALNWVSLGWEAGNGNSNSIREYSYLDKNPVNGTNYYRLKQVDYDGNFEHTDISQVVVETASRVSIYPNPTQGNVKFNIPVESFKVKDAFGTTLIEGDETISSLNLFELKNGIYFIETTNEFGVLTINKVFLTR